MGEALVSLQLSFLICDMEITAQLTEILSRASEAYAVADSKDQISSLPPPITRPCRCPKNTPTGTRIGK